MKRTSTMDEKDKGGGGGGDGDGKPEDKTSPSSGEDQLLGSLTTTLATVPRGPLNRELRSSARVYKKMKLDLDAAQEKAEKKEDAKAPAEDTKKCYRPLWTSDDKNLFFEALNEFGKDFDRIYGYISSKLKKKGVADNVIKTKDQVRHLYYRTWHKISKYVKYAEGIKKVVQELYGLINYGELRKKIGSVSEKSLRKLSELIYTGTTKVTIRGKGRIIVRTPMCKALRRLNQLDEKYDEIRLPNRITVELRPKDMNSFLRVQSIAQNPRIRAELPLQKRLSTLLSCVSKKWKTIEATFYDKAVISNSPFTNECVPSLEISNENKSILNPPLRLMPPENCRIEIPSINVSEYFTTQSICLNSYGTRIGLVTSDYESWHNCSGFKFLSKNSNKKASRTRTDSISDKSPQKQNSATDDMEPCEITDNEQNKVDDIIKTEVDEELIKLEQEKKNEADERKQLRIQTIRKGWIEEESKGLTLGEIYLMFGADSKLVLEYCWDRPKANGDDSSEVRTKAGLSDSLSKLLAIAKLHYRENKIECPCGHTCTTKLEKRETKIRQILRSKGGKVESHKDRRSPEKTQRDFKAPAAQVTCKVEPVSPSTFYHPLSRSQQINSIRLFKPRYCSKQGRRPRSKQVVVERKLPLLPNGHGSDHQIVRMNIISQDHNQPINSPEIAEPKFSTDSTVPSNPVFHQEPPKPSDITLELANDGAMSSTSSSPSRILKENAQWMNSEVADYSLSSLLGHLESPVKVDSSSSNLDDSRLSQDMGAQILSLLTESSMDFSANFADLAAQVEKDTKI